MTRDLYFAILVEVFTNHILVEKHVFHESYRANRTQDYGLKMHQWIPDSLQMS